jgi:hypothetical protein
MSIFSLLLVAFVVMKLAGIIAWSWWWVLAPAWVPAVATGAFMALGLALAVTGL